MFSLPDFVCFHFWRLRIFGVLVAELELEAVKYRILLVTFLTSPPFWVAKVINILLYRSH
jgi:hypothetical protein